MNGQGGIFNRLGMNLINWEHIEFIEYTGDNSIGTITVYFRSGRSMHITEPNKVKNLNDLISTFPDICDEPTRNNIKNNLKRGVKTDIPERRIDPQTMVGPKERIIKTDMKG